MNAPSDSLRVVIAGGGVAALEATLALRALAREPVSIELIAPEPEFVYRPLAVTEPFRVGEIRRFPLARLVEAAGATLRQDRVASVDPADRIVRMEGGDERAYDALLVALGARPRESVPNALSFSGPESATSLAAVLEQAVEGKLQRIIFAVPAGVTWPLPLYELALLTSSYLSEHCATGVAVSLVTPEERPLALFGAEASERIAELLAIREIVCHVRTTPLAFEEGVLRVAPEAQFEADCVIAVPRLQGPALAGLPGDTDGFLPTDRLCHVRSEPDVYAAGDATQFPLKQGGIAAQQADVVAADIARRVGSTVQPTPFRPVLRGLLLTGMAARFLRSEPGTAESAIDTEALWWPPAKIVGRYLAPFLASKLGLSVESPRGDALPVEVEFDPHESAWASV